MRVLRLGHFYLLVICRCVDVNPIPMPSNDRASTSWLKDTTNITLPYQDMHSYDGTSSTMRAPTPLSSHGHVTEAGAEALNSTLFK